MVSRLTSGFFVSQLVRRINGASGFGAIARAGADAAGAIYIVVRKRSGSLLLFGPAPQSGYGQSNDGDRLFQKVDGIVNDMDLSEFQTREERFDPDFWIVEIEPSSDADPLPFELIKP
ncbi:MAG: DUF1491 family protein [Rhizobiaceae bacterium]